MYKAIFFINLFAIFAIGNGSTFKFVHNAYGFKILDYLFLRNINMAVVSFTLINVLGVNFTKLPKSRP